MGLARRWQACVLGILAVALFLTPNFDALTQPLPFVAEITTVFGAVVSGVASYLAAVW